MTADDAHGTTSVPPEAGDAPAAHLVNLSETTVIKAGNVYAITDRDGSLPLSDGHPLGVYRDDCRFLHGHQWTVTGERPRLLVASAGHGSEAVHELTNPPLQLAGGRVLPLQALQLRFERMLGDADRFEECMVMHSYDRARWSSTSSSSCGPTSCRCSRSAASSTRTRRNRRSRPSRPACVSRRSAATACTAR